MRIFSYITRLDLQLFKDDCILRNSCPALDRPHFSVHSPGSFKGGEMHTYTLVEHCIVCVLQASRLYQSACVAIHRWDTIIYERTACAMTYNTNVLLHRACTNRYMYTSSALHMAVRAMACTHDVLARSKPMPKPQRIILITRKFRMPSLAGSQMRKCKFGEVKPYNTAGMFPGHHTSPGAYAEKPRSNLRSKQVRRRKPIS